MKIVNPKNLKSELIKELAEEAFYIDGVNAINKIDLAIEVLYQFKKHIIDIVFDEV